LTPPGTWLALYPQDKLAEDVWTAAEDAGRAAGEAARSGFRG